MNAGRRLGRLEEVVGRRILHRLARLVLDHAEEGKLKHESPASLAHQGLGFSRRNSLPRLAVQGTRGSRRLRGVKQGRRICGRTGKGRRQGRSKGCQQQKEGARRKSGHGRLQSGGKGECVNGNRRSADRPPLLFYSQRRRKAPPAARRRRPPACNSSEPFLTAGRGFPQSAATAPDPPKRAFFPSAQPRHSAGRSGPAAGRRQPHAPRLLLRHPCHGGLSLRSCPRRTLASLAGQSSPLRPHPCGLADARHPARAFRQPFRPRHAGLAAQDPGSPLLRLHSAWPPGALPRCRTPPLLAGTAQPAPFPGTLPPGSRTSQPRTQALSAGRHGIGGLLDRRTGGKPCPWRLWNGLRHGPALGARDGPCRSGTRSGARRPVHRPSRRSAHRPADQPGLGAPALPGRQRLQARPCLPHGRPCRRRLQLSGCRRRLAPGSRPGAVGAAGKARRFCLHGQPRVLQRLRRLDGRLPRGRHTPASRRGHGA